MNFIENMIAALAGPKLTIFRGQTFHEPADTQACYRTLRLEKDATYVQRPGVALYVSGKLIMHRTATIRYTS